MSQRKCYLYIFITGCLWGLIGTFVKILEMSGSSATYSAFLRMFFGCFILGIYCLIKEGYRVFKISKRTLFFCVMLGVFSQGIYNLTYNLAIERIGVSYSAILLNVRARPCFWSRVFRVPKNEATKTKIPPALRVVGFALAYSRKPPML